MATDVPRLKFLLVFLLVRGFGIIQMASPDFQLSAQPIEIETGERAVGAVEIAQGTLQNRARTHTVAFGLVMKSDRQLNQTLQVPAQGPVGKRTPDVFENFMRVKKVGAVEQIETFVEFLVAWQSGHSGLAQTVYSTLADDLHVSID